jgi:hypothetical protein
MLGTVTHHPGSFVTYQSGSYLFNFPRCEPPVPAWKAMFICLGFFGFACEQFHRHAPQWTHFSRSNAGTPPLPSVMAWPLQTLGGERKARATYPLRTRCPGLLDFRWAADDWPAARVALPGRFFCGAPSAAAAGDFGAVCS